jgi:SAM-dependent methyltransferase
VAVNVGIAQMMQEAKSYTSRHGGLSNLLREAVHLYSKHAHGVKERVAMILGELELAEQRLLEKYGFQMRDRDILDVGAGQFLVQLVFFSRQNRAVGIDLDVVPQGLGVSQYATMLLRNGPRRTVKTVGRKALGIDRVYRAETLRQLSLRSAPLLDVRQMDACAMAFRDSCFDLVYSYSVFHHLPQPDAALREIVRVLKPGGLAYLSLHLYTSENGCLDPRDITDGRGELVRWPHLRADFASQVSSHAYLNRLRLDQWRVLFDRYLPGAVVLQKTGARPGIEEDAKALIDSGELKHYSVEELMLHDLTIMWRKNGTANC